MNHFKRLNWVVFCRPPGQNFSHAIAAFNSSSVADRYAQNCRDAHDATWHYRVVRLNADGHVSRNQNKGRDR